MGFKDYVEADRDKNNFCYIVERQLDKFGSIKGSTVYKFGAYKKNGVYQVADRWKKNRNKEEGFKDIKKEIYNLLKYGKKKNYEKIKNNRISPNFKSKILSLYFPKDYLPIFNETHIEAYLRFLNISYDDKEYDTVEKKKLLLKEFKENHKVFKNYSNNIFVRFLYRHVKRYVQFNNDELIEDIDYTQIIKIDFKYLNKHNNKPKKTFQKTKGRDYELEGYNKINIGKKGEKAILDYEISKLKRLGKIKLAKKVRNVSDDTSLGYDIISYDEKGREIHIEVKTKNSSKEILDFYITSNELDKFNNDKQYRLYYLYDIRSKHPKLHIIDKKRFKQSYLQPVLYRVNVDVKSIKLKNE